ncbi:hypothetical protein A2625_04055 [candidate division WOR-1 bacterium RIFCSPHIGHO2_01_FULL_53_15]|uniref:Cell division protein FtsZ C-terminal domain-containing protein n=1 Tax=candidate division WOR-1 bacterium RIFCSPHIGHO2_01_FULL_53_15 TaxID=1802564 RepID=A0A1F4Q237_UNCSA|nr:MAG: hypothetical protein A2625_04055 [candidate division WOR-1 bacterium RIFCSPHIGHO2_01_FULL_53_15]OGC12943.1 MAG: hypothetical protein A3D23_05085 [candidate division WOR-1 bacterium RIFCSPHIGHO2_02_FULL_53_26]
MPFKTLTDLYFDNKIQVIPPRALTFFGYLNELEKTLKTPGLIDLDEADLMTILFGASRAAIVVIESPLKEITGKLRRTLRQVKAKKADGAIFHVIGDENMTLSDVNDVAETIYTVLNDKANIIFGAAIDEEMKRTVRVLIILVNRDE